MVVSLKDGSQIYDAQIGIIVLFITWPRQPRDTCLPPRSGLVHGSFLGTSVIAWINESLFTPIILTAIVPNHLCPWRPVGLTEKSVIRNRVWRFLKLTNNQSSGSYRDYGGPTRTRPASSPAMGTGFIAPLLPAESASEKQAKPIRL